MLREVRELQFELHLDPAALLYLARVATGDSRLRCLEDLNSAGLRALRADLMEIETPRLLAA